MRAIWNNHPPSLPGQPRRIARLAARSAAEPGTAGDIATLNHGGQAAGLSDDQRGVHMVIAKEPPQVSPVAAKGSRFG